MCHDPASLQLLLVRVLYVLGNVTSGNNLNRERLALDCNVVPPLLALLEHHGSQYVRLLAAEREASATAASASGDDDGSAEGKGGGEGGEAGAGAGGGAGAGSSGDGAPPSHKAARAQRREVEELLVKLVRVLANLAIHPDVGARLAVTPGMERLVDTLGTLPPVPPTTIAPVCCCAGGPSPDGQCAAATAFPQKPPIWRWRKSLC